MLNFMIEMDRSKVRIQNIHNFLTPQLQIFHDFKQGKIGIFPTLLRVPTSSIEKNTRKLSND